LFGCEAAAHQEATSMDPELKCGAYEGHTLVANDSYEIGGMALVLVEVETVPDEWVQWLEEAS
jgi:hypothetical protein